ncbi:MAG: hypothetical protein RLZZ574_2690 [Cyanobacteriota bacterium]|jgi:hypothetical protein
MPRTASKTTTKTTKTNQIQNKNEEAPPTSNSASTTSSSQCTLSIKPGELSQDLKLLNTAIGCNQKGLDRLKIEVKDSQSIFSTAGDTIEIKILHKATKAQHLEPIQVSCKQFNDIAARLDNSTQKLELNSNEVSIANRKGTYNLRLNTYKDILPQNNSEFIPVATIKADRFKQALDKVLPFLNSDPKEVTSGVCFQIQRLEDEDGEESLILTLTGLSTPGMGTTTMIIEEVETDDVSEVIEEDIKLVLPKKAISFIASNAQDLILSVADNSLRFNWSNTECTLETFQSDEYPDLEKIKASLEDNDLGVTFNRLDLLNALKRQQVMSDEVEFKIEGDNCQLSHATETGSGAENVFCNCAHDESIILWLHTDYLIKVISAIDEQTVEFKLDLEAEAERKGSSRIVINDKNTMYCLAQLVSS